MAYKGKIYLFRDWLPNTSEVVIRNNFRDVSTNGAGNGRDDFSGIAWKGKVYLFRDHLATKSDVVVTLWHELLQSNFVLFEIRWLDLLRTIQHVS